MIARRERVDHGDGATVVVALGSALGCGQQCVCRAAVAVIEMDARQPDLRADHAAAMAHLRAMDDAALAEPRPTLDGPPARAWRLLMAMVEHEIHHCSQLAVYLALMGLDPPQIYGLGVEDVIARATG